MASETERRLFGGAPCWCGQPTRLKFAKGKGQHARMQHSRWYICDKGHSLYRKRGQQ